jgi:hypothetical protein
LETNDYIYFTCIGPKSYFYEGLINKKTEEITFGKQDRAKSPRFSFPISSLQTKRNNPEKYGIPDCFILLAVTTKTLMTLLYSLVIFPTASIDFYFLSLINK